MIRSWELHWYLSLVKPIFTSINDSHFLCWCCRTCIGIFFMKKCMFSITVCQDELDQQEMSVCNGFWPVLPGYNFIHPDEWGLDDLSIKVHKYCCMIINYLGKELTFAGTEKKSGTGSLLYVCWTVMRKANLCFKSAHFQPNGYCSGLR